MASPGLASKPRASLQTRFGSGLLLRMDQALGSAVQINPKDTALRQRLTELQEAQEQRERAARLLLQAQSDLEAQKLTSAF